MDFDLDLNAFSILSIGIVFLALVFVAMGVKSVSQGFEYTVERFGRYTRTLSPGLALWDDIATSSFNSPTPAVLI